MATIVTLQRVRGADRESLPLEVDQISRLLPAPADGTCLVLLQSGHRIEVAGTVDDVQAKIDAATTGISDEDYFLKNQF